jgi:hypothetical protein
LKKLIATAMVATMVDAATFKAGCEFAVFLRTLLIQGVEAAVMCADKRDDLISRWLVQLTARVGWQKACVAMANKSARILWAVMTHEDAFRSTPVRRQSHTVPAVAGRDVTHAATEELK